ncbi:hypothetical protein NNL26_09370 [Micrococcus luteus]|uniref:hypothetical protein n=1 Tax=Micrococcus luteus TaxID=1270 RepID=UPI002107F8DE|nr:hypothetical protein [Micrococcus luteus]UTX34174.1 hypothetical protein NNL26_09370 [Micrococcus luteus]
MTRVPPAHGHRPALRDSTGSAPGPGAEPGARPRLSAEDLLAARDALAPFGRLSRQEPIEWAAEEPLAPDLADFYRYVGPEWLEIDTLGLPVMFFPLDRLWDEQAGYRWNHRTGALLVDWNDDWTVVAKQGADPFIHAASTDQVLMAPGDEGWEDRLDEPEPVFRDLAEMTLALCAVGRVWAGADDPFTEDWRLTEEVLGQVVGALEGVLGSHGRAVAVARRLGYLAAR